MFLTIDTTTLQTALWEFLRFALPLAISLYVLFSGRSREDRKRQDEEQKRHTLELAGQGLRLTNFQLELERVADEGMRKHQELEAKLGEVKQLVIDVAGLKSDVKHMTDLLGEVRRDLRELLNKK